MPQGGGTTLAAAHAMGASIVKARGATHSVAVESLAVAAWEIPTDAPESDGTLAWSATTLVAVEATAGAHTGVGWTYSHVATAPLVARTLRPLVVGHDALGVQAVWERMRHATRNLGSGSLVAHAIAAVDTALWDLAARLLGVPLVDLLGRVREHVAVYGSGGFTSYPPVEVARQLGGWAQEGIRRVKMKVGRDPAADPDRVAAARAAVGGEVGLMVDANGAYGRRQALALARRFACEQDVAWFEEPVATDDLAGMAWLRERAPAAMEIAGGEYGWDALYYERMLRAGAVDVLQADATRCAGFTGFRQVAELCRLAQLPLSAHTAPNLHAHASCAAPAARDVEWFHDHARIEAMALDGALRPARGDLVPRRDVAGNGLTLKRRDLERFLVVDDRGERAGVRG
jgi:L-alanine-DL-glutamate epimerase-like enolase superfamily enzyme